MNTIGIVLEWVLILTILLLLGLKSAAFQTWLAQRAASFLSKELNAEVRIDRVDIDFFDYVTFEGVYIGDQRSDTVVYVPKLHCEIEDFSIRKEYITISEVELVEPHIELKKYEGDKVWNYDFIEEYFSSDKPKKKDTLSEPWDVLVRKIRLTDAYFDYANYNKPTQEFGIDFRHLCLRDVNAELSEFTQRKDTAFFHIDHLYARDCSGFELDTFRANMRVHERTWIFDSLRIIAGNTRITTPSLQFSFNDMDDFDYFEDKVDMKANLDLCQIDLDDIAYFAPELRGINRTVWLKAKVKGTVNELRLKKMELYLSESTFLKGNVDLTGITDYEYVFIDAQIADFAANAKEIQAIQLPPFDSTQFVDIPGRYERFGTLQGSCMFTGAPQDFVAYAKMNTDVGMVKTDIRFYIDSTDGYFHYQGDLVTDNFRAGYFYEIPEIGNISLDLDLTATGLTVQDLAGEVNGKISKLDLLGYSYSNISILKGKIDTKGFIGRMNIDDPHLGMEFNGEIDFSKKIPSYDFALDVKRAHLNDLKLTERADKNYLCFNLQANASGTNLDNFNGDLYVTHLNYLEKKEYLLDSLHLEAKQLSDSTRMLALKSAIMDLMVYGEYNFEELPTAFSSVFSKVLPAFYDNKVITLENDQDFRINGAIKNFDGLSELFFPNIHLSKNIAINGRFTSAENIFTLRTPRAIPEADFYGIKFSDLKLGVKNNADYLEINTGAKSIALADSMTLRNFNFLGELSHNELGTSITWSDNDSLNAGVIKGKGGVSSSSDFDFTIEPSVVKVNGQSWSIRDRSFLAFLGEEILIQRFELFHTYRDTIAKSDVTESVVLHGEIGNDVQDTLHFDISNFKLENLNPIIGAPGRQFYGVLNGNGTITDVYRKIKFDSWSTIDSFRINDEYLGKFLLENKWDDDNKRIETFGKLWRKEIDSAIFSGYYYVDREKNNIDYDLALNNTNLKFLNAFLPSDVQNLKGLATGRLLLTGSPEEPILRGKFNFQNGAMTISMLNVEYYFGGDVLIEPDKFSFSEIPLADLKGNTGDATGKFSHKNFENWNYDFKLNFKKLLVLNTYENMIDTSEDLTDMFYGRAFATGFVSVKGNEKNMEVNVNAKTEKGTRIVMPLYGTSDQSLQNFVVFINHDSIKKLADKIDLSGITLNFDFDVTPDAEVQLVFDKLSGDMMKGRGAGHLQMIVDQLGDFNMYGQYVIDQGEYLFTLLGVINKKFYVKKGSTVSWYGDPMMADIDLTTIYRLQASPSVIMPADVAERYKKNSDVECLMYLRGNLFQPEITFDISIPRADEVVKTSLNSIRSVQQEKDRQFFSLIAINKFLPTGNGVTDALANSATGTKSTVSEMISSQMSNWLSQLSDEFDIGLNYRPGDEISSDEVALAFSTQLFNDRLTVSTNLGYSMGSSTNQNPSQVIGDVNVEYKINKDGTFRVRGYNESNEFDVTRQGQSPYTQGVGVSYSEEFEKFSDIKIIRKLKGLFRRKKKKEKEQQNQTPATNTNASGNGNGTGSSGSSNGNSNSGSDGNGRGKKEEE